ncbi:aldehyde dehydrogenase family protein [Chromobacterium haemolyticum]|nr:aldehyde dehydrogenase family protein [Chromobacterium haemolyticum]
MNAAAMPICRDDLLQAEFSRLHRLSRTSAFPPLELRQDWLKRLESMLQENRQAFVDAISQDFGHRSAVETRLAELFPSLEAIRYARRRLRRWMRPERRGVSLWFQPAGNSVMPQPLGVIGVVVPWNYPLFLALGPVVSALAAGNRVMVKMSEYTPATGALLQRLTERYLGPDVIAVVNGDAQLAQDFTRLPFDHLFFTGSTSVGRHVMRAAAENLTPVTAGAGRKIAGDRRQGRRFTPRGGSHRRRKDVERRPDLRGAGLCAGQR